MENTGLYMAVLSPSTNTMTYEMCEEAWQINDLRDQQSTIQSKVKIFEIGTGQVKFDLDMGFVASAMRWSLDGKYLAVSSRENR